MDILEEEKLSETHKQAASDDVYAALTLVLNHN